MPGLSLCHGRKSPSILFLVFSQNVTQGREKAYISKPFTTSDDSASNNAAAAPQTTPLRVNYYRGLDSVGYVRSRYEIGVFDAIARKRVARLLPSSFVPSSKQQASNLAADGLSVTRDLNERLKRVSRD